MKSYFFVLILTFIFTGLQAQLITNEESYYTHRYTIEDGLSQSNVNAITKDYEGFLWLGTDEGLNRYDGYEFKAFYANPKDTNSLKDDKIWVLFEDRNKQLWIGTNLGGLNRYDRSSNSFKSFYHKKDDPASISNNSVTSIYEDSKGRLWIGTLWGLNLFLPESESFQRFFYTEDNTGLSNNDVQGIAEKDGELWVATKGGIDKINLENLSVSALIENPNNFEKNINSRAECLFIDSSGDAWLGTNGAGLAKYDPKKNSFNQYSFRAETRNNTSDIILSIIEEVKGELLIGTDGSGLFRFSASSEKFFRITSKNDPTLNNASFYGMYKDKKNMLWLGIYGSGLVQIDKKNRGFHHLEFLSEEMKKIGKNSVLCITEDLQKNIWIGTDGSGLYKYNPVSRQILAYTFDNQNKNTISGNMVKSLLADRSGNLYIGTYAAGLNYLNTSTNKIEHFKSNLTDTASLPSDHIWSLYQDSEDRIWVGLLGGFCEFNPITKKFIRYSIGFADANNLGSSDVTKIYEDKNKNLWVGTLEGGLGRLDKSTNLFKRYQYQEDNLIGLSNNEIKDIFEDSKGTLWVATNGGGLNYYNEELDQFIWHKSNSTLSDEALSVLEDNEGNFWIGTYQGLAKYNFKNDVAKYYTKGAGIQGNEFNYDSKLKSSDGIFYFGGLNGLTYFTPSNIRANLEIPTIAITDFYIFHEPVSLNDSQKIINSEINLVDKLVLNHDQNVITFKYAALDFSLPNKKEYAYRLVGFDNDWNYVKSQRVATYTNLPPGNYIFHVIASNDEGYWHEKGKSIQLTILPPWYQQPWAYILFIAGGLLLLYGIIRTRTGILMRQKKLLEDKVQMRTFQIEKQKKELVNQNEFIKEQNEELIQKNEEIQAQREQLEEKSVLLEKAHAEIKNANDELKKYNYELEKVVDKRTTELKETINQLIKTDEELNTFLYRSSHDLRGPIVTLIGLTQLARMEIKDDQHHFFFDKIQKACLNMLKFLKKLNDSNVLFKSSKINKKVNWNKIIGDVKEELYKADPENKVKKILDLKIDQQIYSDEVMIRTIIQNLMENSIVFCHRNDPFVKLSITFENENLIISVLDNGIGIDPKIHDKIFNMFFRGSGLSTGNGLGLYLVQKAAEIVKGEIKFKSQPRETTEFIVRIPVDRYHPIQENAKEEAISKLFEDKI